MSRMPMKNIHARRGGMLGLFAVPPGFWPAGGWPGDVLRWKGGMGAFTVGSVTLDIGTRKAPPCSAALVSLYAGLRRSIQGRCAPENTNATATAPMKTATMPNTIQLNGGFSRRSPGVQPG